MHIKAFLVTGHIPRARRQVKMMFIPATRKVNYTQGKVYGKINKKFITRNVNNETLDHVPYIYTNLPKNQVSPQKPQCTMKTHIYRKKQRTGSYN
jgi:hypothetical protein